MMKLLYIALLALSGLFFVAESQAVLLPNYAQGVDVSNQVQTKGKSFTDLSAMIVAILAIIGILIAAGKYGTGNGDDGKKWLVGAIIALILDGSVYGIAAMAIN